ncbi:TPA: hypothetical protein N0F65_008504 [Lagenidium giganteum]|uniref:Histidine--tRNA ligase, cytoplasmic n=1 Tax=Lagenidium giganteum TaxID=4803 RepID=A0AAV2Z384_9STRA|nr:TPA: hypothetical protein N0F65_008504 [Lagenidium giganteum]
MTTPAPSRVAMGAAKLAIADVCAIATLGAKVTVDVAHFAGAEAPEAAFPPTVAAVAQAADSVPAPVAKALLVLQLHALIRIKCTNATLELAQFALQLLNHQLTPLVARDASAATAAATLEVAARGEGFAFNASGAVVRLDEALAQAGIASAVVALSKVESALLARAASPELAQAVLALGGARGLLPIADAVAALTCEANRAQSAPFDADFVDATCPHRGIITSATQVRLMLDNSKLVNSREATAPDAECIRHIPQYHGPARDAILAAFNAIQAELNAPLPTVAQAASGSHSQQVLTTAVTSTVDSLKVLLKGSVERLAAATNATAPVASSTTDAVTLVSEVSSALTKELEAALALLDEEEQQIQARATERNARAQEAADRAAAAQAKEDEKLAAMPEAQRLKVLEKRRKKLEKQKEKDSAKKSAKDELKIGAGSTAFRQYVQQAVANGSPVQKALNPFDLRAASTGASTFLEDLFLRLGSGGARRRPKVAKGAQDFLPHQMALREKIFNKIRTVFKRHAGVEIETPVFELKETLTGKYGEDSKLIYDLADQGGELLALRYDLTVPFARYMALHNPGNIKRYHIARVYRRDNPQMARGRFREFYQCDFDIAGTYAPMMADAEVLSIGIEVLQQFPELGSFKVKLSHRLLLDAILAICGVPAEKFRTTCSAIDKLDKESWENVRSEMVDEKGLPEEVADRIQPFVCKIGKPRELHALLTSEKLFGDNAQAAKAMADLQLLFDYLDAMGVLDYISFDLSLARGLDYYTGLIYEFVLTDGEHNVGSIAAGGRYDNLVGMFSASDTQIPCVGVSMGIERIFGILQAHAEKNSKCAKPSSQVLVASTGQFLIERLRICKELWRANIAAETMQIENPKFVKQLQYALEAGIPYMVVIGEDELAKGEVQIKEISSNEKTDVARSEMVAELLRRNCPTTDTLSV